MDDHVIGTVRVNRCPHWQRDTYSVIFCSRIEVFAKSGYVDASLEQNKIIRKKIKGNKTRQVAYKILSDIV